MAAGDTHLSIFRAAAGCLTGSTAAGYYHHTTMAEHHTQGRQGQGSRRRRNNNHGRSRRQRMPRPAEAAESKKKKPSFVERVLRFFGLGKKDEVKGGKQKKGDTKRQQQENRPPRKTRIAKGRNNEGGNPAARGERRRATSTPPTRNARLYVGNLSYEASESELEDLFKGFGRVRSVEIIYNPRTYKSKGYAFVEMHQLKDAQMAAEVLHGQPFMGRELMVSAASERPEKPEGEAPAAPETAESSPELAAEAPAPEQAEA